MHIIFIEVAIFQVILTWFYCLPIIDVVLLMVVVSIMYLVFRQDLGTKLFWRLVIGLLFFAWVGVIVVATLTDRTPGTIPAEPQLLPFHSYCAVLEGENKEILRSNFMNILLFYPAGLLLFELLPKSWNRLKCFFFDVGMLAAMSVVIEFCQYRFALGIAETDDIIHNTAGALMGAIVCCFQIKRRQKAGIPHN